MFWSFSNFCPSVGESTDKLGGSFLYEISSSFEKSLSLSSFLAFAFILLSPVSRVTLNEKLPLSPVSFLSDNESLIYRSISSSFTAVPVMMNSALFVAFAL